MVLLGVVFQNTTGTAYYFVLCAIGVMGCLLSVSVWILAGKFRRIRKQKYDRCKAIEKPFHFLQHTQTTKPEIVNQWLLYVTITSVFFLIFLGIAIGALLKILQLQQLTQNTCTQIQQTPPLYPRSTTFPTGTQKSDSATPPSTASPQPT